MRWLLFAAAALVGLVALIALVGALLPAGHVAARRARYRQSAEALFATLTDFAAAPTWRKDVKRVELLPPREGRSAFREQASYGDVTYEVDERTPPRRLVVRIADETLPYGGAWTYELAPDAGGTRVTITERGHVKNVIFRFLSRFVFSHHAMIDRTLRALGAHHGEAVTPEPAPPS